ncbi:MAG: hypothetical protein JEY97_02610 [Bacteroidales bacterium]|nr:hypothetical protein [Bacteroidales bacterium]
MKKFTFILIILLLTLSYSARTQQASALQNIQLQEGYSFVSTYISPDDPDLMELLEDLLFDGSLEFVRNSAGQMFHKIGENWINNIGNWNTEEGYLFFMNSTAVITIEGELFDHTVPLSLNTGYQFASYYYTEYMDVEQSCTEILNNLDFIRNTEGQMFRIIGPHWINNIVDFHYGEGYLIKMNNADELIYVTDTINNCPSSFIDPRDGQEYGAVMIGEQCWMAENLNIGEMINGSQSMTENGIIEKYCYDNDAANCEIYGGLYQWEEMMDYTTNEGAQGICLNGWHIPSDEEWKQLEGEVDSLYGYPDTVWDDSGPRGYDAGLNLKSQTGWAWGNGTDLYGFSALPAGHYSTWNNGSFYDLLIGAYFWTTTIKFSQTAAWMRELCYSNGMVFRTPLSFDYSLSVRCIKD